MKRLCFVLIPFCLMLVLATSAFANGQMEQNPVIQMNDQPKIFIAPGNAEASVKNLILPFSTITFTAKGQGIKSWTFKVFDSTGKLVYEDSKLETRDRGFFGELFNIGNRPQVEIPKELFWNGTYKTSESSNAGKLVSDGNYTYQISLTDTAGGRAQTPPFNVTVRNSKVIIDYIRLKNIIFSPIGQRSFLSIEQSGSREFHWEGIFSNKAGKVVRTILWENTSDNQLKDNPPPAFEWDGKDQNGNILPEGEYFYTLIGKNRSGAATEQRYAQTLTISLQKGLLSLKSDLSAFSPMAEKGLQNVVHFLPEGGETKGLKKWTLKITNANLPQLPVWSKTGTISLPEAITFEGKNLFDQLLPEGHYLATFSANYDNGNSLDSNTIPFDLDLTPPRAELKTSASVFGGTERPGVSINLQGTPDLVWTLEILDPSMKSVLKTVSGKQGDISTDFNGLNKKGSGLPDGIYTLQASTVSKTGILGIQKLQIQKDTRPMKVDLDLSSSVLAPGTKQNGVIRITPVLAIVDSIEKTDLIIQDPKGNELIKRSNMGILTFWDWKGIGQTGKILPDGKYQIILEVTYLNGTVAKAIKDLTLDSKYLTDQSPQVEMSLSSKTFVPGNVDGPSDLTINIKTIEGVVPVQGWQLSIIDPRGKVFRHYEGKGLPPKELIWDGYSDKKEIVESGEDYQILLKVFDSQNRITRKQDSVSIDILVTKIGDGKYKIVISSIQFAGYSSDIFKVREDLLNKNLFVLQRLSKVLNKFPDYNIRLEGYAVSEFWYDTKLAEKEQKDELLPLSLDRAQEVHSALVLLGVDSKRFSVKGFGSENPLVPNKDLDNRWKNRRVEFYLDKM